MISKVGYSEYSILLSLGNFFHFKPKDMLRYILAFIFFAPLFVFSQTGKLKGIVKDYSTNEAIIGAYVYISDDYRARADMHINYTISKLPDSAYKVKVSM